MENPKTNSPAVKAKKKKKTPLVFKPYLKGTVSSAFATKRGLKLLLYYLAFVFVYLIVGSALSFDNLALRLITNLLIVACTLMLLYSDGVRSGDDDVAFAEIALQRKESGKNVDAGDLDRCYHPLKGVYIVLIAAIPLLLCTGVYAALAEKQTYALQSLPGWVASYSRGSEISQALNYYNREVAFTFVDGLRIVCRLICYPFVNIATVDNADALLLVDRLSPLICILPLLGYIAGYLQGPRSRALVHGSIASNTRRHLRRQKKAARARQQKSNTII